MELSLGEMNDVLRVIKSKVPEELWSVSNKVGFSLSLIRLEEKLCSCQIFKLPY